MRTDVRQSSPCWAVRESDLCQVLLRALTVQVSCIFTLWTHYISDKQEFKGWLMLLPNDVYGRQWVR